MTREETLKKARDKFNGCTLFDNREKETLDFLENTIFQIDEYYYLNGENSGYYAFTITNDDEHVFLSNKSITEFISETLEELREFEQEALVKIELCKEIKLKNGRTFRPIKIKE